MELPLKITFHGMNPSPALEARIRERAERLDRFYDRITAVHVTFEAPHRHRHKGRLYKVRIVITVPGGEVVVNRSGPEDQAHDDPKVAIRDAFDAVGRRLQDYARRQRGDIKAHEGPTSD